MSGGGRLIGWLLPALLAVSTVMADDGVGRLFSTPADRAELDRLRSELEPLKTSLEADVSDSLLLPSQPLFLNGLIQRSDGRTTVWVNGERLDQQGGVDELTLRSRADQNSRVKLRLHKEPRNIALKPGQAWDPVNQQVIERYRVRKNMPQNEHEQPPDIMNGASGASMMDGS